MTFKKELEHLINRHSVENESDTPDFILAEYIRRCLDAWNFCIVQRDTWWGTGKPWVKRKITLNEN